MRDIFLILLIGSVFSGLAVFAFQIGRGPSVSSVEKFSFSEWFGQMTRIQKADENLQAVGDKMRENDARIRDSRMVLDERMRDQRRKIEADQERIRAMQQRNEDQKRRLAEQMERLKRR